MCRLSTNGRGTFRIYRSIHGEDKMKRLMITSFLLMLFSSMASATINLNVKIDKMVGNQLIVINKTISTDYNKEVVISSDNLKNQIILNFKKFTNVQMNGKSISPVQVDMRLVNKMRKTVGHPQTVTSFYNRTAQFKISSSGDVSDVSDLNVSLKFEETN
jgi:hypothetical protein